MTVFIRAVAKEVEEGGGGGVNLKFADKGRGKLGVVV